MGPSGICRPLDFAIQTRRAAQAALSALRAVATECLALAAIFGDEHAAEGLAITDKLHALFQRPATASAVSEPAAQTDGLTRSEPAAQTAELLCVVPPELMSIVLSHLGVRALACLAATCHPLWCDTTTPLLEMTTPGLVETELRQRAEARGLHIGSSLPEGALTWVAYLLKCNILDPLRREAPLAVGGIYSSPHSLLVDKEGRLHIACGRDQIKAGGIGKPLLGHDWGPNAGTSESVPPMLVPSMQDTRIVSVATGSDHCLALSAVGEVYSWGEAIHGALGHADVSARAGLTALGHTDGSARAGRAEENRDAGVGREHRGWTY